MSLFFCYTVTMSNRFVVVSFLDKSPTEEFASSEWPLHMTLLPPFIYDGHLNEVCDELDAIAVNTNRFSVRTNGDALFGPNEDIPVELIEPSEYLSELHTRLASLVTKLGLAYEHPSLSEDGYRFHITTQRGQRTPADAEIQINGFSLVDKQANNKTGVKKVVKSFDFVEKQLQ